MLQTLSIKNVALIKDLSIELGQGFNVFLGETGAGKSIILDALGFVLGFKSDKGLIRTGESQMKVDAFFTDLNFDTQEKLKELGLVGEEISLQRTLTLDGKSQARINGLPVTNNMLKAVGEIMVDIAGQHESVQLKNVKNHIMLLDKFGGKELTLVKDKVAQIYHTLMDIKKEIDLLGGEESERERAKSILIFQINEIESAKLNTGEDEEIKERLSLLSSAEKIGEAINVCENLLEENSLSVINNLYQSGSALAGLNFPAIEECKTRLDSARIEIEDIKETLSDIKEQTLFNREEYDSLDRRYDLIKSLKKKYGGSLEKVMEFLDNAKVKLNNLEDSEFLLNKLNIKKREQEKLLTEAAIALSQLRKKKAKEIENKIVEVLQQLGMKSASFLIKFEEKAVSANGIDDVEFTFSANKGQEVRALSKTASGGEMSRFMLAVKNIFAKIESTGTMIFDEIDSGISGETGMKVGEKISELAFSTQILCVTHLAQVAACGQNFFLVEKLELGDSTVTKVTPLESEQDILYNVAKLISGEKITEKAIAHVKEMRRSK